MPRISHIPCRIAVLAGALLALAPIACKSQRTVSDSKQSLGPILEKFAGNYNLQTDANGMTTVQSDRRSEFESRLFTGTGSANVDKQFRTSTFNGSKEFQGTKAFQASNKGFDTGEPAREANQKSRWHMPWQGGKPSQDAGKQFDQGEDFDRGTEITRTAGRDADKSFPTREDPKTLARWEYQDKAIHNYSIPAAGGGPGPTIRDVRSMLGKDD